MYQALPDPSVRSALVDSAFSGGAYSNKAGTCCRRAYDSDPGSGDHEGVED